MHLAERWEAGDARAPARAAGQGERQKWANPEKEIPWSNGEAEKKPVC